MWRRESGAIIFMKFIKVNDALLDYDEYRSEVSALRYELLYELCEVISKYGFQVRKRKVRGSESLEVSSVNKSLGLVIEISMSRE